MELNYHLKLNINNESSLKSIQQDFNKQYPFLKIEFSNYDLKERKLSKKLLLSDYDLTKKIITSKEKVSIAINKEKKVCELEKELSNMSGLCALIFRKSGNVWIETSLTDDWTLKQQNKEGEQISFHFK